MTTEEVCSKIQVYKNAAANGWPYPSQSAFVIVACAILEGAYAIADAIKTASGKK